MFSNTQLNSDSNYVYLRQILSEMIELEPEWLFGMLWPKGTDFKYYDDGFFKRFKKNVVRIPKRWQSGKYRAGCDYDVDFFYDLMTKFPHNLIWNNTPEQVPVFYNVNPQSSESWKPVVVNYHHFPAHTTLPGLSKQYLGVQGLQALGTYLADVNVFNSKYCRNMARDVSAMFLGSGQLMKIEESSVLNYMGPIERGFPETVDYSKPVFFYNHRIAGYKNWSETFDMFSRLWDEGLRFEVIVTCVDAQMVSRVGGRQYVRSFNAFTRDQYLELLPRANINVSNSQHETFCISMVESMAAGHACLAPHRVTFPELFNNGSGGLLFESEEQQLVLMRRLIGDEAFRREWGEKGKAHARAEFSAGRYASQAVQIFKDTRTRYIHLPKSEKKEQLEAAIRKLTHWMPVQKAYRRVQAEIGWMDQAFPMRYFTFAAQSFDRKFKIENSELFVGGT